MQRSTKIGQTGKESRPGLDIHRGYPRDTDAEHQFDPFYPWYSRVAHVPEAIRGISHPIILDCGANTGGMGRTILQSQDAKIIGVDVALHLVRLSLDKGYAAAIGGDAQCLPFKSGAFDVVIASELLEHVEYPQMVIRECSRVLKPKGMLLGDVPTWYGRWGYRSLWGHKWHVRAYSRYKLWALLVRHFRIAYIRPEPRWPTRHLWVPQWYTFRGERR